MNKNNYQINNKFKIAEDIKINNQSAIQLSIEEQEKAALIAEAIYQNYNQKPQIKNIYEEIDNPKSFLGLISKYFIIGFFTVGAFIITESISKRNDR